MAIVLLTGKTRQKYKFTVHSKNVNFNAVGAVYAITRSYLKANGITTTHNIIYIGQTSDLSYRFDNHHQIDCFNLHNWNRICVHPDGNEASRLEKEHDLIDKYNPPCNSFACFA